MTVRVCCSQEERRATRIQAASWMRAAGDNQRQVALLNQQVVELRRRNEDKQRRIDRLLTQELQMQLMLSAMEVRGDGPACEVVSSSAPRCRDMLSALTNNMTCVHCAPLNVSSSLQTGHNRAIMLFAGRAPSAPDPDSQLDEGGDRQGAPVRAFQATERGASEAR